MKTAPKEILENFHNPSQKSKDLEKIIYLHALIDFSYVIAVQAHHLWTHALPGNPRLQECAMRLLLSHLFRGVLMC